jgi:hypothetical protein
VTIASVTQDELGEVHGEPEAGRRGLLGGAPLDRHDARHEVGPVEREPERDRAADRVRHDHRVAQSQRVEHGCHARGLRRERVVGRARARGPPDPQRLDDHRLETGLGQPRGDVAEGKRGPEQPRDEHDRLTVAHHGDRDGLGRRDGDRLDGGRVGRERQREEKQGWNDQGQCPMSNVQ